MVFRHSHAGITRQRGEQVVNKSVPLTLVGLIVLSVMAFAGGSPAPPAVFSAGPLAISPDGRTLLATNPDSNTLSIINLD